MTEKWEVRKSIEPTNTSVIFQTLDWYCDDLENPETGFAEYSIFTFGISDSGEPINLKINNFYPFFFVELPDHYDATCVYSLKETFGTMVKSIEFVKKKRYYGFENNKIRKFVKLTFWNYRCYRSMSKRIATEGKYELYESNIDPILCFTHIRDILTAGWVSVKNITFNENGYFECSWTSVSNYPNYTTKPCDTRIMYFDIEACSEDGSFPNALKKNDKVTQICCINKDTVSKKVTKYLFNLGTIGEIEDTIVIQFKTEKDLLISFSKFIVDTNPDIIVGYNIFGFDNGFMFERAKVLGIEDIFNFQSKIPEFRTEIVKKVLNNQQSGFNDWKMTKIIGRTHIDLLQVIKKDFKLESYKLDYVGEHFLQQGKDDVTPKEIFEAWNKTNGSREKRTRIGKYCVQDTNLCLLLFEKFAVLPNHIEMAKVTRVPLEYLITRGQSIKVFSQIAYETRKTGYLIPTMKVEEATEKFQGATVLKAKIGHYTKPVCGLDFASLYPSIMIAHNMCYSTIVLDNKYLNIPGVEYSTIAWTDSDGKDFSFSFVQSQDGVLSGILQSLWKNRKITKKEMNTTKDPFEKVVLNAKQLAIKVSMNSIYGFTGATVGALPCLGISQSVTGCGRQMIEQTQRHAQEMFNCEIIYGDTDSCYVIFPEPVDQDGTLTTLFKVAQNAAKKISETFKKPIELEFEKFMYPLILVAKKRYLYLEWTEPEKHNGEIEAKGVELVRRDNCPYVKETLEAVLHPIMFDNNPQEGRNQAEIHIDRLLEGNVPVKSLILSKNLRNDYKGYHKDFPIKSIKKVDLYKSTFTEYPLMYGKDQIVNKEGKSKFFFVRDDTAQKVWFRTKEIVKEKEKTGIFELTQECPTMAHVALVEKMISRDPNGAPKPGDRVPFVYVDIGDPKALSWKKTEDPVYVVENNISIDSLYYLDHQVRSPLETIFDIIIGPEECKKMFERKSLLDAKKREKISIGDAKRKKDNNKDIRSFFKLT
jgi:DNA polymerase delta subunit 1